MPSLRSIVAALLALTPITAHAQCAGGVCPAPGYNAPNYRPPAHQPPAATTRLPDSLLRTVARIVQHQRDGQSLGTGTLIASDNTSAHVLTCAHLFEGDGAIEVRLNGERFPARLIAIDKRHDLALLRTPPVHVRPAQVEASRLTGPLTAGGFGPRGAPRFVRGPVLGYATAVGAASPSVRIRGAVRPGDSGGPVFDAAGRLVAVVWGARSGETFAMGGAPLRRLLEKLPRARPQPIPRTPPPPPSEADPKWRERIEQRLDQIASRKPAPLPEDLARRQDLQRLTDRLDRQAALQEPPASAGGARRQTTWLRPDNVLTTLAVGGPLGVALWAGRAWLRRRATQRLTATRPIAVDTPPPPQQTVPETHYVPYERDEFAKAHQWACEQLARKFPGSVEMLASLDSLIKQQLNGG